MTAAADRLAAARLEELDDAGLLAAIKARKYAHDRAVDVYVADFVPFAHGVRLFGAAYNDVLHPDDPYEFTDLLTATPMLSLRRNAALQRIAGCLRDGEEEAAQDAADAFVAEFGAAGDLRGRAEVLALALRLAARAAPVAPAAPAPGDGPARPDATARARRFVEAHPEAERERAEALLDLARASWRLRDDDNLYLDRLRRLLDEALAEAERRGLPPDDAWRPREVTLPSPLAPAPDRPAPDAPNRPAADAVADAGVRAQARQIVGQPAGPGLAVGPARVVRTREDLAAFADGEILVCDAIEPEMTFIVPLAAGIVERRGGMLIHGAIIAREYGLPCVTGVPRAAELIRTGDRVTVDGYLGIVIVG